MSNLNEIVLSCSQTLKSTLERLPTINPISQKSLSEWTDVALKHSELKDTASLLDVRRIARDSIEQLRTPLIDLDSKVKFNGIDVPYAAARHLALISYCAITWSIYDRLANICGRMISSEAIAKNPKKNPKLCEDLIDNKKEFSFKFQSIVNSHYSWPVKISYKIRNWLVHEGEKEGDVVLFDDASGLPGHPLPFSLTDASMQRLEQCCGDKGLTLIDEEYDPWRTSKDLLKILDAYNNEIDQLFCSLLKWSVSSFESQVLHFGGSTAPSST